MTRCIVILLFLLPITSYTQRIAGKVINSRQEPLAGANVYWLGTKTGILTNTNGEFVLEEPRKSSKRLVASYVGYLADTIATSTLSGTTIVFTLQEKQSLTEIVLESQRSGVIISNNSPIKVEQITQTELRKSACCDLAGCFETHHRTATNDQCRDQCKRITHFGAFGCL
jgi:outer membrane receptor for ferrienterochelin and colicins